MSLLVRAGAVVLGLTTVLAIGSVSLPAQEPGKDDTTARKAYRRVPAGFSKVGISPEQKEKIYTIRGTYYGKVADLKKQLTDLQAKELAECEAVLTDAQRKLLVQQRAERKGAGKAATKSDAAKTTTEEPKKGN